MVRTRISVRALRRNLSVYLRRIAEGESYEVTDRDRPVAVQGPLAQPATVVDRLAAGGRLRKGRGHLADLAPAPALPLERPLSDLLEELRDGRR